jgi:ribonuclease BN (tRNA processing enzyme)
MGARLILFGIIVVFAAVSWVFSFEADRLQSLTQRVGVLDHRRFETLTIITAGTGAAQEDPERLGPAIAVGAGERLVLVDAGRAAAEALRSAQLPLDQVDTVFLTSLLPENVVGLPELLLTGWAAQRERPLRLVGPPGTRALAEGLERAYALPIETTAEGLGLAADGARLEAVEAGDGWSEERDGLAVRAGALGGGPLPALAYRFESGRRAAVVNGVGWGSDSLVKLAEGADVLLQEAMHTPTIESASAVEGAEGERIAREAAWHTPAAAAGDVALRAGVRKLVLVRLRPPPLHDKQYLDLVREHFKGPVLVAEDADEITR